MGVLGKFFPSIGNDEKDAQAVVEELGHGIAHLAYGQVHKRIHDNIDGISDDVEISSDLIRHGR